MMKRKVARGVVVCGLGLVGPLGCAGTRVQPVDSALFFPPSVRQSANLLPPTGDIAVAQATQPAVSPDESPKNASVLPSVQPHSFDALKPLDPLQVAPTTQPVEVQTTEIPVNAIPAAAVISPPVESLASKGGLGVYMTLGGVVAQVNDTPIFASQVLTPLKKELAAKAREGDPNAFKEFAELEIHKELQEQIQDELYFAIAYHALSEEDRKLADAIAMHIRQEKVTAAGGSVERAKKQALESGQDFDDLIKQEYRHIVLSLHDQRQILPLIHVTADDMREDYNRNLSKLYTEKDKAQFRVIEINPAVAGGMQAAREKINSIRERALRGEDFTKLASTENQSDFLKGRGGNPCDEGGWMDRNSYRYDAVEAAVWKLEPGQITPVVETEGGLYIAKLEAKQIGTVRPFDDQTVQEDIYNRLRQQQLAIARMIEEEESQGDATVVTNPDRIQIAVDMAMQTYGQVHRSGNEE